MQGVTYRVQAKVPIDKVAYPPIDRRNGGAPDVGREITLRYIYGEEVTAREYDRAKLQSGDVIEGPADHPRGAVDHPGAAPASGRPSGATARS